MNVIHRGHRYWAHGPMRTVDRFGKVRFRWAFWSSHKPVLYHGSVTLLVNDEGQALEAFRRWLPFRFETQRNG